MKYKHYEYIGDKIGMPLYYCIEEDKFYLHEVSVVSSGRMIVGIILLSIILSPLKKWNDIGLPYNETIYILGSIIIGGGLGLLLTITSRRGFVKYFSQVLPIEPLPAETLKKIVLDKWITNIILVFAKVFIFIILLFVPVMLREERSLLLLLGYPICWFVEVALLTSFSTRRSVKMLINIKKLYINNPQK